MATATEVDVAQLVDSAFDECNCGSTNKEVQHQGKIAGLWVGHTCATYLICEAHFKWAVEVTIPRRKRKLERFGHIVCAECGQKFLTVEEFITAYPL